jgi:hypothetical protein
MTGILRRGPYGMQEFLTCAPGVVMLLYLVDMTTKGSFPVANVAKPRTRLRICIFCGVPGMWRIDRRGRYFFSCSDCRTRVFMHSHTAIAGMEHLHELAMKCGPARLRQIVLRRAGG